MTLAELRRRLTRPWVEWAGHLLGRLGVTPNLLTVGAFLLALGAAATAAFGQLIGAGLLFVASGALDLLDGAVARATRGATAFGALLDSTLDRASEAALLFGLLWLYRGEAATVALIYLTLVGSFLVSYIRARAEGLGLQGEVGIFTRGERMVVLALGLLLGQVVPALALVGALAYVTAGQRLIDVWRQTRQERRG